MSQEMTVHKSNTALTIAPEQTTFNDKQVSALRQLGVKDASPGDLAVFFHQSVRTGLDPFARQIYMIGRWSKEGTKYTIQTGIDGYRLIARRASSTSGETLSYDDNLWCGQDGVWRDVWLSPEPPAAAKVTVYRGQARFSAVALWNEYVQTTKNGEPNTMWGRMGAGQLAKCAEALALRKAFPQDLSGIYTDEEMAQADARTSIPAHHQRPVVTEVEEVHEAFFPATKEQFERYTELGKALNFTKERHTALMAKYGVESFGRLSDDQALEIIEKLDSELLEEAAALMEAADGEGVDKFTEAAAAAGIEKI